MRKTICFGRDLGPEASPVSGRQSEAGSGGGPAFSLLIFTPFSIVGTIQPDIYLATNEKSLLLLLECRAFGGNFQSEMVELGIVRKNGRFLPIYFDCYIYIVTLWHPYVKLSFLIYEHVCIKNLSTMKID